MKRIYVLYSWLFLIAILNIKTASSQALGNEWINYNQKYYSFKVAKNGLVRINYSALIGAGITPNTVSMFPKKVQVFGRGVEQFIYITNESTGIFGANDYIEFYAQANDGWLDKRLYTDSTNLINPDYSLFNDTATYFLTVSNTVLSNPKRITADTTSVYSGYTATPWFYSLSNVNYNSTYYDGIPLYITTLSTIFDPEYNDGEAWLDDDITIGESKTKNISTPNPYTAVGAPYAKLTTAWLAASNYTSASPNHHVRLQYAGKTFDTLTTGYQIINFSDSFPASTLGTSVSPVVFKSVNDIGSGADRNALAYLKIKYPRGTALANESSVNVYVPAAGSGKTLYNFTNFNAGGSAVFYDITNHKKYNVGYSGSDYKVLIVNSAIEKQCLLSAVTAITNISTLTPVGTNGKFIDVLASNPAFNYLIISHTSLINSKNGLSGANDYATYRNSKGYKVLVVDAENLYDQYAYGIYKNPVAIRNFIRDAVARKGTDSIQAMFIIGKGYRNTLVRKDPTNFSQNLIPVLGNPPSDLLFSYKIVDTLYQPAISTGRLSAKTLDHVDLYLDKIMEYEDISSTDSKIWKKKLIHFSGGSDAGEQLQLSNYLKNYERIIEDTLFGGNVTTIYKTTNDPIQINLSDQIKSLVNNGVSIMTFFGHAAGIGFDISIDNPTDYSNKGKYPFLIANSCYAGDIFQSTNEWSFNSSEEFVLIRDKGMIAYLASVTPASSNYLNTYSTEIYKNLSYEMYNEPVGLNIKRNISYLQGLYQNSIDYQKRVQMKELALEMTLHGDPAIKIATFSKPDYYITPQSYFTNPPEITNALDSFDLHLIVSNQGIASKDSIIIELKRSYSDGSFDPVVLKQIRGTYYIDTVVFRLPVNQFKGVGLNKIDINVDVYNNIPELNDFSNNSVSYSVNIKSADIIPVYPPEFAIVSGPVVSLSASTVNPFSAAKKYVFEIDTTTYFNSPAKISHSLQSMGGVLQWSPSISLIDSTVYYWRISLDTISGQNFNWRTSSFQYINGKDGWSQAHFYQFANNGYQLTKYNLAKRKFEFVNDVKLISCKTGVIPYLPGLEMSYRINGVLYSRYFCFADGNGMNIAVFDPVSVTPWLSHNDGTNIGPYGNYHCTSYDWPSFDFPSTSTTIPVTLSDTSWFSRQAAFIAQIPDSFYVLAYTLNNGNVNKYPEYLYKAFDTLGSTFIRQVQNNQPYILFGQKGNFGNAHEITAQTNQSVYLNDSIITNWREGFIQSPVIGPALSWKSLHWRIKSVENPSTDSVRLKLIGIKSDGTKTDILSDLNSVDDADVLNLDQIMDPAIYPYCQLICYMRDDTNRTPAQLQRWQVIFQSAPEIALDPITQFDFYKDTIQEGDSIHMSIAVRNLSKYDMDSVTVHYWIMDKASQIHEVKTKIALPIPHDSYIVDSVYAPTLGLEGDCQFWMETNPLNSSKTSSILPEVFHSNNIGEKAFFVLKDKQNPILDITFDGIHILDGDIVSANPEILISLNDENKYLALQDTSLLKVFITNPAKVEQRIYFNEGANELMLFEPAQLPNNKARIFYNPKFALDGKYSIRIQAKDASNNESGNADYSISFEIINKATITEVMNWPNPFTTKTHFVFTLTGSEVPDYMKIQIMTITGKVVKEIDMSELGNIHIGRNITEYAWDGTDMYGDRLANGVYLYRVISKLNDQNIEKSETYIDSYFTNGFGKMYLMR